MLKITANNMYEAYVRLNLLFTNLSSIYYNPPHNVFGNDHFLNAFNIVMEVDSQYTDLTLESIGYSNQKILHLIKSYLDPQEYQEWIEKIVDTTEKFGKVDSDIGLQTTRNNKHGNGPCLFGFSFRSHITPVLTVYSHSVELPQIFGGDTLLIAAMAQHIAEATGTDTIKIVWYISSARINSRAANFFRLSYYPLEFRYMNDEFEKHVKKLQQEYGGVVIDQEKPKTQTGVKKFLDQLKRGWKI